MFYIMVGGETSIYSMFRSIGKITKKQINEIFESIKL